MLTQNLHNLDAWYTNSTREGYLNMQCDTTLQIQYLQLWDRYELHHGLGWTLRPQPIPFFFSLNAQYGFNRLLILGSGQIPVSSGPGSAWEPRSIFSTIGCARSWGILWVNTEDITKLTYMEIEIAIKKEHSQNPITSYHSFKQKIHDSSNSEINLIGCVINHSTLRFENPV